MGQYAIQLLRLYGYTNILTTASPRHHDLLKSYGARVAVDYKDVDVAAKVLTAAGTNPETNAETNAATPAIPLILDCIGSHPYSLTPLTSIAQKNSVVAVLLPVIIRDASPTIEPIYSLDPTADVPWAEELNIRRINKNFYLENQLLKEKLQGEIMPAVLERGWVKANKFREVNSVGMDGQQVKGEKGMLMRAEKALSILRDRGVSGERLVWRVSEDD